MHEFMPPTTGVTAHVDNVSRRALPQHERGMNIL